MALVSLGSEYLDSFQSDLAKSAIGASGSWLEKLIANFKLASEQMEINKAWVHRLGGKEDQPDQYVGAVRPHGALRSCLSVPFVETAPLPAPRYRGRQHDRRHAFKSTPGFPKLRLWAPGTPQLPAFTGAILIRLLYAQKGLLRGNRQRLILFAQPAAASLDPICPVWAAALLGQQGTPLIPGSLRLAEGKGRESAADTPPPSDSCRSCRLRGHREKYRIERDRPC